MGNVLFLAVGTAGDLNKEGKLGRITEHSTTRVGVTREIDGSKARQRRSAAQMISCQGQVVIRENSLNSLWSIMRTFSQGLE